MSQFCLPRVLLQFFLLVPGILFCQEPAFKENWSTATSNWFSFFAPAGSLKPSSNFVSSSAIDGKALQLTVSVNSNGQIGSGPEVETSKKFLYGTFSTRIKTVDCSQQPDVGTVTGFFTYFNDGSDLNKDGLPDNSEIDMEWLCADPQFIYLTMFTDYDEADSKQRRVTRGINLATGKVDFTFFKTSFVDRGIVLTGKENQPATLTPIPGFKASAEYYEYGISWAADQVIWWIINPANGQKIILWDYQGPKERIPARPSFFMTNAWYTSNWYPDSRVTAIQPPTAPIFAFVDWSAYDPMPSTKLFKAVGKPARLVTPKQESGWIWNRKNFDLRGHRTNKINSATSAFPYPLSAK